MQEKIHLTEVDLAWLSELDTDGDKIPDVEMAEHLRWCADCRSVVADHRWLQEKITATLAIAADAVPVPRPKWWRVQEVLFARQQRQIVSWRGSTIVSVVLAVCLILSASPVLGTAAMIVQTSPEAVIATAPGMEAHTILTSISLATPTPATFHQEAIPSPTPVLMLPPTPDQSGI